MDTKQSIEFVVLVITAMALIASFFNLMARSRRPEVGYTYRGGDWPWGSGNSHTSSDPGSTSSSQGGDGCSGGYSGDAGSCGGGGGN
jgi:uncharacterized membrane protein YgcG